MTPTKKLSRASELKLRMLGYKPHIPHKYMEVIMQHYPIYNTPRSKNHIYNVIGLKCVDESITNIIEELFIKPKQQL